MALKISIVPSSHFGHVVKFSDDGRFASFTLDGRLTPEEKYGANATPEQTAAWSAMVPDVVKNNPQFLQTKP